MWKRIKREENKTQSQPLPAHHKPFVIKWSKEKNTNIESCTAKKKTTSNLKTSRPNIKIELDIRNRLTLAGHQLCITINQVNHIITSGSKYQFLTNEAKRKQSHDRTEIPNDMPIAIILWIKLPKKNKMISWNAHRVWISTVWSRWLNWIWSSCLTHTCY